ncbi:MAG: hypothetical protein ACKOAH_05090 [Pirellula sp.]
MDEAQKALDDSHDLQPENAWLFYFRALLHIARKQEKLACQDFQKAIDLNQPPIPEKKSIQASWSSAPPSSSSSTFSVKKSSAVIHQPKH